MTQVKSGLAINGSEQRNLIARID